MIELCMTGRALVELHTRPTQQRALKVHYPVPLKIHMSQTLLDAHQHFCFLCRVHAVARKYSKLQVLFCEGTELLVHVHNGRQLGRHGQALGPDTNDPSQSIHVCIKVRAQFALLWAQQAAPQVNCALATHTCQTAYKIY